jgi:beta-N-acetylhexosaminidase
MKITFRKGKLTFMICAGILLTLTACSNTANNQVADPIENQMKEMTMSEKVGQMLMVGIDGATVSTESASFIQKEHIGGAIINGYNVISPTQLLHLNNQFKEINAQANKSPIFLSVDEEGGKVSRMPPGILNLPNSKDIGDKNDVNIASKVGLAIGERVKAFGFNMTMSPVMDINSNPNNPIIGVRSFGNNADVVTRMGIAEMQSIQKENIIPVVKHFPGHGDTDVDSHKGLPIVYNDINRLNALELVPFKKAIQQNADMTMVAHILIPKLDPLYPSSLSKIAVTDLLRKKLHFNGVIITDDLTMGAILQNYDIGDAAVKAIQAGNDIALVCHGLDNQMKAKNAILAAAKDGNISEQQINESVYRILKLKKKYHLNDKQIPTINISPINQTSEEIDHLLIK